MLQQKHRIRTKTRIGRGNWLHKPGCHRTATSKESLQPKIWLNCWLRWWHYLFQRLSRASQSQGCICNNRRRQNWGESTGRTTYLYHFPRPSYPFHQRLFLGSEICLHVSTFYFVACSATSSFRRFAVGAERSGMMDHSIAPLFYYICMKYDPARRTTYLGRACDMLATPFQNQTPPFFYPCKQRLKLTPLLPVLFLQNHLI